MKKFRCKNLLITGGAGFIGSNFIGYLLKKYDDVKIYNLDSLTYAGNLENTKDFSKNKRYKFIQGNICDINLLNKIFKTFCIDGVINFAAETHVDNSIVNPELFISSNVIGVFNLLNTSYKFWMKSPHLKLDEFKHARFHQISTDEVYGSIKNGSFTEKSPYLPNSPYSASKASADMLVRSYFKTYGLNITISISSNNYGKNQNNEKLIPKIISNLKNNKNMSIYGDGLNVRNWLHVLDNSSAIDLIFNHSESGESYNIGSDDELTNLDVFKIIYCTLFRDKNYSKKIIFVNDRPGHDYRYSVNSNKIKSRLKWDTLYSFGDEIKKIIKLYK